MSHSKSTNPHSTHKSLRSFLFHCLNPLAPPALPTTAACSSRIAASTRCCVSSSANGSCGVRNVVPQNAPPGSNTLAISATASLGCGQQ